MKSRKNDGKQILILYTILGNSVYHKQIIHLDLSPFLNQDIYNKSRYHEIKLTRTKNKIFIKSDTELYQDFFGDLYLNIVKALVYR